MFFGIEWMAYRKMYLEAVLSFALVLCATGAASLLLNLNGRLWGDFIRTLIGVLGNMLYRKKALRVLHKTDGLEDAERMDTLSHRGGVSPVFVVVLLMVFLCSPPD